MDIRCLRCGEPWDADEIRHEIIFDAIFDGGLWPELKAPLSIRDDKLRKVHGVEPMRERWGAGKAITDPVVRKAFKKIKWVFGQNILTINHCPACTPDNRIDTVRLRSVTQALSDVMGDDLDGLATDLSDLYG